MGVFTSTTPVGWRLGREQTKAGSTIKYWWDQINEITS